MATEMRAAEMTGSITTSAHPAGAPTRPLRDTRPDPERVLPRRTRTAMRRVLFTIRAPL